MSESIKSDRISESSILRAAGNIACGLADALSRRANGVSSSDGLLAAIDETADRIARTSVVLARAIAAEVQRTASPGNIAPPWLKRCDCGHRNSADLLVHAWDCEGLIELNSQAAVQAAHSVKL